MFCPNCGAQNSTEQTFCRSCGLNIETSISSLTSQIAGPSNDGNSRSVSKLDRFGQVALTGFGLVAGIGVLAGIPLLVLTLMASGFGAVSIVLITLFFIFGLSLLTYVVLNEFRQNTRTPREFGQSGIPVETGRLAIRDDAGLIDAPSVVEDSTKLLAIPRSSGELR